MGLGMAIAVIVILIGLMDGFRQEVGPSFPAYMTFTCERRVLFKGESKSLRLNPWVKLGVSMAERLASMPNQPSRKGLSLFLQQTNTIAVDADQTLLIETADGLLKRCLTHAKQFFNFIR
ncbi:hypothetical protein SIN8267_02797 [Sinobacterium norvegicum]|uniref:Uncharacterized protein n=1 Tax=Sinobacterium norvegicum TaxID=1641715 RepID=A0ABN8EN29_9GAMM|nr:hypothetical protein SIN8267_02797 [Sinobacterium norvegicum]